MTSDNYISDLDKVSNPGLVKWILNPAYDTATHEFVKNDYSTINVGPRTNEDSDSVKNEDVVLNTKGEPIEWQVSNQSEAASSAKV